MSAVSLSTVHGPSRSRTHGLCRYTPETKWVIRLGREAVTAILTVTPLRDSGYNLRHALITIHHSCQTPGPYNSDKKEKCNFGCGLSWTIPSIQIVICVPNGMCTYFKTLCQLIDYYRSSSMSWGSSVSIVPDYGLTDRPRHRSSISGRGSEFFFWPLCPWRHGGILLLSLLSFLVIY
jgi:hypothetical protein